jgi:hypothetical protein
MQFKKHHGAGFVYCELNGIIMDFHIDVHNFPIFIFLCVLCVLCVEISKASNTESTEHAEKKFEERSIRFCCQLK